MARRQQSRLKRLLISGNGDERGQASMVTVAMFLILFSVIVVGFTYVMITVARQTVNDTLQAAAKAAAESGVEDAKRLLVYCSNSNNAGKAICQKVIGKRMEDTKCGDIVDNLSGVEGFTDKVDEADGGKVVMVGGDSSKDENKNGGNNEYYRCLKIATLTEDYRGIALKNGASIIVPLKIANESGTPTSPDTLTIEWHRNDITELGDQYAKGTPSGDGLPPQTAWDALENPPAILRVEQTGTPKNSTSINTLIKNDVAVTLRPSTGGASSTDLGQYWAKNEGDAVGPNKATPSISTAKCTDYSGPALTDQYSEEDPTYACKISLGEGGMGSDGKGLDMNGSNYYLRINALYRSTHFKISVSGGGKTLYFDGVQPLVEATGKSSDSYSRVQAWLLPIHKSDKDNGWYPEYAVATNGQICKDMMSFKEGQGFDANGKDYCTTGTVEWGD